MLQRQSKNNDLVIQLEGAGIRKVEYYTDGIYKYETTASGTIYIPSSELQKMNDGQLKSTIYITVDNDNFTDGTQDRVVNQRFAIWIGEEVSNDSWWKDEVEVLTTTVKEKETVIEEKEIIIEEQETIIEQKEAVIEEKEIQVVTLTEQVEVAETTIAEKQQEIEETTNALALING